MTIDFRSNGTTSSMVTSWTLPGVRLMNVGIEPRKSSSVWSFMAALVFRKVAHGNSERHRSMVVESRAYNLHSRVILYAQAKEPQTPEKASPVFG